jgi:glycosyltransferase involved in cell wall biosynthesis
MRIALLAPIAWRVPPRHYGPWERVVALLARGLTDLGADVTTFATLDSVPAGKLDGICPHPYEEDDEIDAGVWSPLHIGYAMERAGEFDVVHNHFDFGPLAWAGVCPVPLLTTIHGFSSHRILPAYRFAQQRGAHFVSISDSDRHPDLRYAATVHHGIDLEAFTPRAAPHGDDAGYLLFFGRIHPDKGAADAIQLARRTGHRLVMAGIVQDERYWRERVEPHVDGEAVRYVGSVGPDARDRLLGGAAALLHPIHFDEPFGLSVVEAMACGTPVIATHRGSMPEVVTDGVTGALVGGWEEGAERLGEVLRLDRQAVRAECERRFSRERMAADYLRVYRDLLNRS